MMYIRLLLLVTGLLVFIPAGSQSLVRSAVGSGGIWFVTFVRGSVSVTMKLVVL